MTWEDPAEGMLTPQPRADERAWREQGPDADPDPWVEDVHYRWEEPESSGCWVGCLVVGLSTALVVAVVAVLVWWLWPGTSFAIDCGPEGKPVMNGHACIDREPAVVTSP